MNNLNQNLGLVIQGPLLSRGINGRDFVSGKSSVSSEDITNYNCLRNIESCLKDASDKFEKVIISTWASEKPHLLEELQSLQDKNIEILVVEDPGSRVGKYSSRQKEIGNFHANNKIRQFRGKEEALKILSEDKIGLSLMVRSDQKIDMQVLVSQFKTLFGSKKSNGFFVPYFLKNVPWAIPDFYMGGDTIELLKLSRLMQSDFEFHNNVHRDLFFKGVLAKSPTHLDQVLRFVNRKNDIVTNDEVELLRQMQTFWLAGSEDLFSSLIWRGEKIIYQTNNYWFANEYLKVDLNEINYPIGTKWRELSDYFYFVTFFSEKSLFVNFLSRELNFFGNKLSHLKKMFILSFGKNVKKILGLTIRNRK
jgi:hypothetical protein